MLAQSFEPSGATGTADQLARHGPLAAFKAKETEALEAIAAAEKVIMSK
jgi:hypothetical protein